MTVLLIATGLCALETDAFSREALLTLALDLSPGTTLPVMADGTSPVFRIGDFNRDGTQDIALISIASEAGVPDEVAILSQRSRLFDADVRPASFFLEVYLAGSSAVIMVDLGYRLVWAGLELLDVKDGEQALLVGFLGRTGVERELVSFSERGSVSRLSFVESLNEFGFLADINEDGSIDLVTSVRSPEAGRGFETFLFLFEYREGRFARTASVPVVRSLQEFTDGAARAIQAANWDEVAASVADGRVSATAQEVLRETFTPLGTDGNPEAPFFFSGDGEAIEAVVFPTLRESPIEAPFLGESFRIAFRVDCCDGASRYFQAWVQFSRNPFRNDPVAFLTDPESGK